MSTLTERYTATYEAVNGDTLDITFRASSDVDAEECAQEHLERLLDEEPAMQWRLCGVYAVPRTLAHVA